MDYALLPFQLPFMQNAFLICVLLSIPAGLLSTFLVLKGWSLLGDAISHGVLPGIVSAYILGIPLIIGAFIAGMICALLTGYVDINSRVKRDTAMGVIFSGMFGIGVVMVTQITTDVDLDHILFGNMLGVGREDIMTTLIIALVVTAGILLLRRDLLLHAFDEQQAKAAGLPVNLLYFGLLASVSLTVVAALKAVGIILAIAFLVGPGATAFLLTKRFGAMMLLSVLVALASSLIGIYASFFLDSAPAPTIVLVMTGFFIAAFLRQALSAPKAA